ncbi:hypothetical protein [Thermaurantiacus sp.]
MMNPNMMLLARQVAKQLFATEEAIDDAIREAADLARLMPIVRAEARVSVAVGHDAIESAIATIASLGQAREQIKQTHEALAATQAKVGLRERNYGGFIDKPRHRGPLALVSGAQESG